MSDDIPQRPRRCKILSVPCWFLEELFKPARAAYVSVPTIEGIPKDATIIGVIANPHADAIDVRVYHPRV